MKKHLFALFIVFCFIVSNGQITIIGHVEHNNSPLYNTIITVKQDGILKETINTKSKSDFIFKLKFDYNYVISFTNSQHQNMFMEIIGNNIPKEKIRF